MDGDVVVWRVACGCRSVLLVMVAVILVCSVLWCGAR